MRTSPGIRRSAATLARTLCVCVCVCVCVQMKSYENISTWVVAYWHDIVVVILPESGIEIMLALGLLAAVLAA